jgi:hypothetical protein
MEPFNKQLEDIPRVSVAVGIERHAGKAVDKDAARADRGRVGQQEAIRLLDLLPKDGTSRRHELESPGFLQRAEIPAKGRGIRHDPLGRHLESDDDPGFIEVVSAAVQELQPQRRLAGSWTTGQNGDVAARYATQQDRVETCDSRLDEITRHSVHPLSAASRLET